MDVTAGQAATSGYAAAVFVGRLTVCWDMVASTAWVVAWLTVWGETKAVQAATGISPTASTARFIAWTTA